MTFFTRSLHRWLMPLTLSAATLLPAAFLPAAFLPAALLPAAGLLASGCARGKAEKTDAVPAPPALLGTRWQVMELRGALLPAGSLPEAPWLKLDPTTHQITGYAGCNRFSGTFELADDKLRFGPLKMTRRFCREGMDIEQSMGEALSQAAEWKIFAGALELSAGPVVLLRAIAAPDAPTDPAAVPAAAPLK